MVLVALTVIFLLVAGVGVLVWKIQNKAEKEFLKSIAHLPENERFWVHMEYLWRRWP